MNQLCHLYLYVINLHMEQIIHLTVWNEIATTFDMEIYIALPKPTVMAISSCRVKENKFNAELQLSKTSAMYYYFNPNVKEFSETIDKYRKMFEDKPLLQTNRFMFTSVEQQNAQPRPTLAQLLEYTPSTQKGKVYTCEGTIGYILTNKDWFYYGCPTCRKILKGPPNKLRCPNHETKGNHIIRQTTWLASAAGNW
ncbi:uncharacterized protein [Rutidosis leptorrhynchoides]|uniref:uncharacterized protein isoform X2 n=1 Tax=Rutidosis leptorrhynchoides TaxID=125765 RepID=UPI003A9973CB